MKQFFQIVTEELSPSLLPASKYKSQKLRPVQGFCQCVAGRVRIGGLSWSAPGEGAWHREPALARTVWPWLYPCWMKVAEPTPRLECCTATVFGHKLHHVLELSAACSQPGLFMTCFLAPMSSKYPIKHYNCPHSSSCDSVSIHDPLLLPGPYKERGIKTS